MRNSRVKEVLCRGVLGYGAQPYSQSRLPGTQAPDASSCLDLSSQIHPKASELEHMSREAYSRFGKRDHSKDHQHLSSFHSDFIKTPPNSTMPLFQDFRQLVQGSFDPTIQNKCALLKHYRFRPLGLLCFRILLVELLRQTSS